jgi:solute carrier family 25 phosphate transporter 3
MSEKAQAKAGGIELYSAKYYAACTVGGILACVRLLLALVAFFSN